MKKRPLHLFLLSVIGLALASLVFFLVRNETDPDALIQHGIEGPIEATPLPTEPARTSPSAYAEGGGNALALYVNDTTASWLGLAHGLKSVGVPVKVFTDAGAALRHSVVIVYPSLTGANTSPELRDALERHVRDGGTLIAFAVVGGGLRDVFGFVEAEEVRGLKSLHFAEAGDGLGWRPDPEEREILLADSAESDGRPGVRYRDLAHPPLALYDDGSAAIVGGSSGKGWAYAIGADLGHFILRARNGRFDVPVNEYINRHRPKVDGILRFLKSRYLLGERDAVTLHTAPDGRPFVALVTHDVDYAGSMDNVEAYSADEVARGIPATYFIQTKYVKDYSDEPFFDITRRALLQRLAARGMEVASHTVAHSSVFHDMPFGTGTERFPTYKPFVQAYTRVRGGTVLGELRVSKYLLETLSGETVVSFRPGHLSLPASLPQGLAATGYRYSSSMASGRAMTHLPYRMMYDRGYTAETPVYEFPVTIEDERWNLVENIEAGIALARAVGRRGGFVNLMIHTDTLGGKQAFLRAFHAALKDEAWFGTLSQFGDWWVARDQVTLEVEHVASSERILHVFAPQALSGLTLEVPAGWNLVPDASAGSASDTKQLGRRVVLGHLSRGARIALRFTTD